MPHALAKVAVATAVAISLATAVAAPAQAATKTKVCAANTGTCVLLTNAYGGRVSIDVDVSGTSTTSQRWTLNSNAGAVCYGDFTAKDPARSWVCPTASNQTALTLSVPTTKGKASLGLRTPPQG